MTQTTVEVHRVAPEEAPLLAALVPDYLGELGLCASAFPGLALYWVEPGYFPYLVRVGGVAAGFALVRWVDAIGRFEIAEFYVARAYRRHGVGRRLLQALLGRHAGPWMLSVLPSNRVALTFWRAVLPADTHTERVDQLPHWPHLRLSFATVAPA